MLVAGAARCNLIVVLFLPGGGDCWTLKSAANANQMRFGQGMYIETLELGIVAMVMEGKIRGKLWYYA